MRSPASVAAPTGAGGFTVTALTLPVGVVRVLVGDLGTVGAVTVTPPAPIGAATDAGLLARLLDGIRAL